MGYKGPSTTVLAFGKADRVLAIQPENTVEGSKHGGYPPTYLHLRTAAAELPARCASIKAMDVTAPRIIVLTPVYLGCEAKKADMM